LISLATGKKLWPNRDALGQSLRIPRTPNARKTRVSRYEAVRVIGISRDVVSCCAILGPDAAVLYLPTTPADAENTILVRVNGDAESIRQRLDAALAKAAPGAVDEIHRMDELRAAVMYPFTAASWLCEAVGGVALLLTLSGIYGVLSYLVAQRRKEIGIRVAMGATSAMVTGLVLRQSIRLAFIGIGIGAALALVVSRLLASRLVMMDTFDAVAYCSGVLLVLAASAAAAYFPSRRAARIDPLTTLRYD
jgi:predicted lysophospholipase L1 biosynthesis ABC-type transport system permease subunit